MLRRLADRETPAVAVLLTGDGGRPDAAWASTPTRSEWQTAAGGSRSSWDNACRRALKHWASAVAVYLPPET
jgi:hypothetical protein